MIQVSAMPRPKKAGASRTYTLEVAKHNDEEDGGEE